MKLTPSWIATESAVVLYCIWQSSDLPKGWMTTPSLRLAWIAFAIWLIPAAAGYKSHTPNPLILSISIAISLLGTLASFNTMEYFGMAIAFSALTPWKWSSLPWLLTSVSWMPAFGWTLIDLPVSIIFALQVLTSLSGTLCCIQVWRYAWK